MSNLTNRILFGFQEGVVYAVEFSLRLGHDLINMAKRRTNVIRESLCVIVPRFSAVVRTFCVKNLIRLAKHDIKMVGIPSHQVLTQNLWLAPGG